MRRFAPDGVEICRFHNFRDCLKLKNTRRSLPAEPRTATFTLPGATGQECVFLAQEKTAATANRQDQKNAFSEQHLPRQSDLRRKRAGLYAPLHVNTTARHDEHAAMVAWWW